MMEIVSWTKLEASAVSNSTGRREEPRTVLEDAVRRMDRTYDELAADFCALARNLGETATISSRHLRRLASGERCGTTPATRRVLQVMFGRQISDLLALYAPPSVEIVNYPPLNLAEPSDAKEMLYVAAQRARKFALVAGQSPLTAETMEQIQEDVHSLALAYPREPLPRITGQLVDTQDTLFSLLERRPRPAHARELYLLSGVIGGLLAKASHDLADPGTALTQARTAYICAEQADHPGLRAWIRGLQSLISYWAGRPQDAVRYAQAGAEFAGNTTAVWLPASEARGWAVLGNDEAAQAAMHCAEDAWPDVKPDELDALGGICTFGRTRQLYYAADTLAWLPAHAAPAEDYSAQAVTAYQDTTGSEWAFGDQAGSHADLAIARVALGELDGAVEAIDAVLELPVEQRNHGIVVSVRRLSNAVLRSPLSAESRELQERIEVFSRTTVAASPR
jgi:hypothetical protein